MDFLYLGFIQTVENFCLEGGVKIWTIHAKPGRLATENLLLYIISFVGLGLAIARNKNLFMINISKEKVFDNYVNIS